MNHKQMLKVFAVPVSAAFIMGIGHQVVLADETEQPIDATETVDTTTEQSTTMDQSPIQQQDVNASATVAPQQTSNVWIGQQGYASLEEAVKNSNDGDTITLGEGRFTLYNSPNIQSYTKGKSLTFIGQGIDKTYWGIGATVPDPSKFGTEYNGDYSFDGAKTVTFKDMTLQSKAKIDYLGFIRIDDTIVEDCKINGKTFYWGYKTATFKNTTFDDTDTDYAIWTYSSPIMTFDGCTFHGAGKYINVYTDYSTGKENRTVNINNCTFITQKHNKSALNINDSNMGNYKYYVNFTGHNVTEGIQPHTLTCSPLFGFSNNKNNSGRLVVKMDGVPIWQDAKMVSHFIDTANDKYTDGYKDDAFDYTYGEWVKQEDGSFKRHVKRVCQYCGYAEEYDEIKAAPVKPTEDSKSQETPASKAPTTVNTMSKVTPNKVNAVKATTNDVDTSVQTNIGLSILGVFAGIAGILGYRKKNK